MLQYKKKNCKFETIERKKIHKQIKNLKPYPYFLNMRFNNFSKCNNYKNNKLFEYAHKIYLAITTITE